LNADLTGDVQLANAKDGRSMCSQKKTAHREGEERHDLKYIDLPT